MAIQITRAPPKFNKDALSMAGSGAQVAYAIVSVPATRAIESESDFINSVTHCGDYYNKNQITSR